MGTLVAILFAVLNCVLANIAFFLVVGGIGTVGVIVLHFLEREKG